MSPSSKYGFAIIAIALAAAPALADSSGNFTAVGTSASCTATPAVFSANTCTNSGQCPAGAPTCVAGICTSTTACTTQADCPSGTLCGLSGVCVGAGAFTGDTLSGGTTLSSLTTEIKTPNGYGTTLLIRPSVDTGLFTKTSLTTTIDNATADVGIQVCVFVDPTATGTPGHQTFTGGLPVFPSQCVVYDQRIQQISNTLFGNLATCVPPAPSGACTVDTDCPVGDVCVNPTDGAGAGLCQAPAPGCNFQLLLTTLAAHSFDFVVPMPGNGTHNVAVVWSEIGSNKNTTNGSTMSCVGPAEITIQQVKNFHNDSKITFTSN
jgi:hypothetical protein